MEEICKNCGQQITENYCSNCGQKKFKKIDKKYLLDELQYTVFHSNKGLLYSLKTIFINPGKTAREYIEGNRINHYKPILLVFVLSGIATFISYKILNLKEVMTGYFEGQAINSKMSGEMMTFLSSYNAILMLLLLPLFALTTKIAFRKWGNNYYEHVVINAYILSYYTIISIIVIYPIMFFFRNSPDTFFKITQYSILIVPFILVWFFKEFYKHKPLKPIILRVLAALCLTFLGFILVTILTAIIIAVITIVKNPEGLQSFQKK